MTDEHATGPFLHARWFGTPVKRREDPKLLTGTAAFIDDIALPGTLHMAMVRSPHAHARILGYDTSAALALPGVVTAVTGEEAESFIPPFPPNRGYRQPPRFVLAREKVRKVGEQVAAVFAEDRYTAADAAELVTVE